MTYKPTPEYLVRPDWDRRLWAVTLFRGTDYDAIAWFKDEAQAKEYMTYLEWALHDPAEFLKSREETE